MTLIAIILAVAVGHAVPAITGLRRTGWFSHWVMWMQARAHGLPGWAGPVGVIAILGAPLLVIGLLQWLLASVWFGLLEFAFGVVVLLYCWGSRDLDQDVAQYVQAVNDGDPASIKAAAETLLGGTAPDTEKLLERRALEAVFGEALRRWFAVLFWFAVLGPLGAVLFRLAQRLAETPELRKAVPARLEAAARRLLALLFWPVTVLATLGLAISGNFDAVMRAWRRYHARNGSGFLALDTGYLPAAGRATVLAAEHDPDHETEDEEAEAWRVRYALQLVWRALIVWLTVIALLTLAGWAT